MSQPHRAWKPSPASKPPHLSASEAVVSKDSLAALQGATTAFVTNPQTNASTIKQLQKQYGIEPTNAQEDTRKRGLEEQNSQKQNGLQRSPSRGRHLSPQDARLMGTRSAVTSRSPPMPTSISRQSSMIAARLASANSSPVRSSTNISPPNTNADSQSTPGSQDRLNVSAPSRPKPGAAHSFRGALSTTKDAPASKMLDLNKIPPLPPIGAVIRGAGESRPEQVQLKPKTPEVSGDRSALVPPDTVPYRRKNSSAKSASASPDRSLAPVAEPKPHPPVPRRGAATVCGPLQRTLTGNKQYSGLSRDEAINRMADAMVASSLASTRTPSPTKAYKAHGSRRRSASAHALYRDPPPEQGRTVGQTKTPRPMKQTLRKASPDEDDEDNETTKRGRRHLVRKHPNKHHEGDRKRWRDKVTDMERKRYEGLFAANRGRLLKLADPRASPSRLVDPNSESNQVVNIVVRDIWERSRLPTQALEQVYNLVAPDGAQSLSREQFVVGLWLIDQKLKGRKLPVKVSQSVWASVRHSQGIKMGTRS